MYFYLAPAWASKANTQVVQGVVSVLSAILGNILNIIRLGGTGIAIIMITWMSIQYFTADGRGGPWGAEKQADLKGRQLINFTIGAICFIGASNIIYFIMQFVVDMFNA